MPRRDEYIGADRRSCRDPTPSREKRLCLSVLPMVQLYRYLALVSILP